jgi:iron-sulfur cluster assembly accessory protein
VSNLELIYLRMIQVSETAMKKVMTLMEEEGFNTQTDFVRVGVKSGGCSGLSYELTFDKTAGETDKVFEDKPQCTAQLRLWREFLSIMTHTTP